MKAPAYNRRSLLIGAGLCSAALIKGPFRALSPAQAQSGLAATKTMRGGSNNYVPNAPFVDNLGPGFVVSGTVRRAVDGAPLADTRIQIWAATTRGGERDLSNHGSVMTQADGSYRLEMVQIVPNFGQPHAHLAYDDGKFETVFLRPVMGSASDTSVEADFVLAPA